MLPRREAVAAPTEREGPARPATAPLDARDRDPTPDDLVAQLAERHGVRRALPFVVALLAKVAGWHRRRNAKLGVLCDVGVELAEALEAHLDEEERELFPALLAGAVVDRVRPGLERMRRRHRELALLLARVRWLADDFAVPPWGGRTYQALMEELAALEGDVLEQVSLEAHLLSGPPGAARAC